jgi:D-3-phosphoglycerate dehydrogenase
MGKRVAVVTDTVFPNLDITRQILSPVVDVNVLEDSSANSIAEATTNADAVLVTYAQITGDIIRRMNRCRIIARYGIGVDNVDVEAATEKGIVITNVPDYCIEEVSDHAVALLLALARKLIPSNARVRNGKWEMSSVVPIRRLRGSALGLIGFGRIAQQVASKSQAFGMRVMAYDPYISAEVLNRAGVQGMGFEALLASADYISIHVPLGATTHHLFGAAAFRQMKDTAYIINTARGGIIDEPALIKALDAHEIAGAALDVLEIEPPSKSHLLGRNDVILTPHTSFYSEESLLELQTKAAEEVTRVLQGKPPRNPVNPKAIACS